MVLDPAQVSLELGNDPRNMTAMFAVKNSGPTAFRYTIRLKNDEGGQKSALASQIEVTPSMQGVLQAGAEKELTVKYLPPFRPGLKFRLEVFASTMHEGDDDDPLEQGAQRAVRVLQQQVRRLFQDLRKAHFLSLSLSSSIPFSLSSSSVARFPVSCPAAGDRQVTIVRQRWFFARSQSTITNGWITLSPS